MEMVICTRLKSHFFPNLKAKIEQIAVMILDGASSPNCPNKAIGATTHTGDEVSNCTRKIWDVVALSDSVDWSLGRGWMSI